MTSDSCSYPRLSRNSARPKDGSLRTSVFLAVVMPGDMISPRAGIPASSGGITPGGARGARWLPLVCVRHVTVCGQFWPYLCDRGTAVGKMSDQGRWRAQRVQRPCMRPNRHMVISSVYVAYRVHHVRPTSVKGVGWVAAVRRSMSGRAIPQCDGRRHGFRAAAAGQAALGQGCPTACMVFRDDAPRGRYGGVRPLVVIGIRGTLWDIRGSLATGSCGDGGGRLRAAHYHVARACKWSVTSSWLP